MEQQPPQTPKPAPDQGARSTHSAMMTTSALLLLAIIGMVNYLAYRHYARLDWTSVGMFTLSPKSVEVIKGLETDIDIYLFLSQGEPSYEQADELLKRYQALSKRVHVHHVDPDRENSEFKVIAQRFGVLKGVMETGEAVADVAAVVAMGDKNWHVGREDLVAVDFAIPGEKQDEVKAAAEQALTGAVVQVTSGRATKVCVTTGHGEWTLEQAAERSLTPLKEGMRHDNMEWAPFETLGKKAVPADCDAVFVLGPAHAFSEAEADMLDSYLASGGNLLMGLDPVIEHDQINPTGLEAMLQRNGIRLDPALVLELDPNHLLTPNPVEFVVTEFNAHATTAGLQGRGRVFMALARSVNADGTNDRVTTLLRSSPQAYGETDLTQVGAGGEPQASADDLKGPVSLAVALQVLKKGANPDIEPEGPGGRLIVVGDTDMLSGQLLQSPELANYHLAASWTGWLTARSALIQIPPKKVKGGGVVLTQEDLDAIFLRVAILLPAAALFAGIAAWLNRRS